jgi:ribonuclease BN (tRNA processing enzyme)
MKTSIDKTIKNEIQSTIKQNQRALEEKLCEPRSSYLKDSLFILRKWNSTTPLYPYASAESGGGYFLKRKRKGIVIDPGFNFIRQFYSQGFRIQDIDVVVITHDHGDHSEEFGAILALLQKLNKINRQKGLPLKKIDFFGSEGVIRKFQGLIDRNIGDQISENLNIEDMTLKEGKFIEYQKEHFSIKAVKAFHDELWVEKDKKHTSVGLIFTFHSHSIYPTPDQFPKWAMFDHPVYFNLGITSDTAYARIKQGRVKEEYLDYLCEAYKDTNILILHLGSIEKDFPLEQHLGFEGCFKLITCILKKRSVDYSKALLLDESKYYRPFLAVISEFGEEVGTKRIQICEEMREAVISQLLKDRKLVYFNILPSDIGTEITLSLEPSIFSYEAREYISYFRAFPVFKHDLITFRSVHPSDCKDELRASYTSKYAEYLETIRVAYQEQKMKLWK